MKRNRRKSSAKLLFGVVAARFNPAITRRLERSCLKTLKRLSPGCEIETVRVPGSFELPWAARSLAGSGRFDTRVMERLGRRVFCKVGAEGVYCAAFPDRGLGIALKIDDGGYSRAADVAMAALIESGVSIDDQEAQFIHGLSDATLSNWNGIAVGRVAAAKALRSLVLR